MVMMMDTKTVTKPLVVVDETPYTDNPGQFSNQLEFFLLLLFLIYCGVIKVKFKFSAVLNTS